MYNLTATNNKIRFNMMNLTTKIPAGFVLGDGELSAYNPVSDDTIPIGYSTPESGYGSYFTTASGGIGYVILDVDDFILNEDYYLYFTNGVETADGYSVDGIQFAAFRFGGVPANVVAMNNEVLDTESDPAGDITATKAGVDTLVANQGNWLTATGFATPEDLAELSITLTEQDIADISTAVNSGILTGGSTIKVDSQGRVYVRGGRIR
jgi:hypothetical protein